MCLLRCHYCPAALYTYTHAPQLQQASSGFTWLLFFHANANNLRRLLRAPATAFMPCTMPPPPAPTPASFWAAAPFHVSTASLPLHLPRPAGHKFCPILFLPPALYLPSVAV